MSKQINLAYCIENSNIAKEIEQDLKSADYTFNHIACDERGASMGEKLSEISGKIILLVSDNFLRSVTCMKEGQTWFQSIDPSRLLPIVIDGRVEENGVYKTVPTSFAKVSNVIKYMNFWQEKYLELRKNKREGQEEEVDLKDVRTISSEVGEFLRHIRTTNYLTYLDFQNNRYEQFFRWTNDMSTHENFVTNKQATPPEEVVPVTEITDEAVAKGENVEDALDNAALETTTPEDTITEEISSVASDIELAKPEPLNIPVVTIPSKINEIAEVVEEPETIIGDIQDENLSEVLDSSVDISDLDTLSTEEVVEENEFDSLINEIVIEEHENEEGEGVYLEDLNEDLFAEEEELEEEETVTAESLMISGDLVAKENETQISDEDKRHAIESFLHDSRNSLAKGKVPAALNILKNGTEKYPEELNLRYYYAFVLANSAANPEAAKKEIEIVLEQSPNHADANYLAGEIAELEEDFFKDKGYYQRVVVLDDSYPNVNYRLASILAKRFRGQDEAAKDYFKVAAKQDKSNIDALFQLAHLYETKLKNNEKAEKYYHKVLRSEADNSDAFMGLARVAKANEDEERALNYYKKAVEIDTNLATHSNQRKFAPKLVIPAVSPVLKAKDLRLKELEADIVRLQNKLSEMEEAADKQSDDQKKISSSIHKISGTGNGSMEVVSNPDTLEIIEKKVDKVVFITGATSGIGRATAELFARNGYRLIITGRRAERLENLRVEFEAEYQANIKTLNYDVRNPISVKEAVQSLEGDWRNVDILINNAGLAKGFAPIQEGDMRDWEQMIDTNIKGLLYMTRAVSPHMVERRGGHIINVCSTAEHEVYPNGNVYCATKHAVDALTKSMRIDLHKHNIRVSQVSPGHVEETEFALVRFDGDSERAKIYDDFKPLTSSDVAETIYFMATRPAHVNIQDVLLMGTQQASSNHVDRSGR